MLTNQWTRDFAYGHFLCFEWTGEIGQQPRYVGDDGGRLYGWSQQWVEGDKVIVTYIR